MANQVNKDAIVRFLTGYEDNLSKVDIENGTVYFALKPDPLNPSTKTIGSIYLDANNQRIMMSGESLATLDEVGDKILTKYIKGIDFDANSNAKATNNGAKGILTYIKGNGADVNVDVPSASASAAGFVTTGAQTFAGAKTFKSPIITTGGSYVHSATGTSGTSGYVKIATFKINGPYQNTPIVIELVDRVRKGSCVLNIQFQNENSNDPTLATFTFEGADYNCYLYKSATSTWDLYVEKGEAHGQPTVVRFHKSPHMSKVAVTWTNAHADTIPSGAQPAVLGGNVANASQADSATKSTGDGQGNNIYTTYLSDLTSTNNASIFTIQGIKKNGGNSPTTITIKGATTEKAGLVTTGAQTWAGAKTFKGALTVAARATVDTLKISKTEMAKHIEFARGGFNYIATAGNGCIAFLPNGASAGEETSRLIVEDGGARPGATNTYNLGTPGKRWKNIYGNALNISGTSTLTGAVTLGGNLRVGGTLGVTGATTLESTLDVLGITKLKQGSAATSTTTGALQVTGGIATTSTSFFGNTIIMPNPMQMLRWTSSTTDNNTTGCSWYGIGTYTNSDSYNWLNISNYWGINITTRGHAYLLYNGNVLANTGNASGTVGSEVKPVYVSGGVIKASAATVGDVRSPIFMSAGQLTTCDAPASGAWFIGVPSISANGVIEIGRYIDFHSTNTTAKDYSVRIDAGTRDAANTLYLPDITGQVVVHKNNTQIGSGVKPVYVATSGAVTASSSTVGATDKPVFMSDGEIKPSTSSLGNNTKFIYMSSGQIKASTATVGASDKPVYMNDGTITESNSSIGNGTQAVYMANGQIKASTSSVGGSTTPMYLFNGIMTSCDYGVGALHATDIFATDDKVYLLGTSSSSTGYRITTYFDTEIYITPLPGELSCGRVVSRGNLYGGNNIYLRHGTDGVYARLFVDTPGTSSTTDGIAGATGVTYMYLGNSKAVSTAAGYGFDNSCGVLRIYGSSSGYTDIRCGIRDLSGEYTLYLPRGTGQIVYHTNDTQIGGPDTPVFVTFAGKVMPCRTKLTDYVLKAGDTMTGNLAIEKASGTAGFTAKRTDTEVSVSFGVGFGGTERGVYDNNLREWIIYSDGTDARTGLKLYGAVWNDYAEFRQTKDKVEPGRVVIETGRGDLKLSTERLQPGANVVSDTFGFAIGETKKAKTPLAVAGRVLVYTFEDKYSYKPGDAVCTGPNGTVSKMTREEIWKYPERIVGTVSEIPEYEIWESGDGPIQVNSRIWIKVK